MINLGYSMNVADIEEFKKFKDSAAYGFYLKSIASSPVFTSLMNEHVKNIDISSDIKVLKSQGKLPDSINADKLSELFKSSIAKMAICVVADSIILKELEDVKLQDIILDLGSNADVNYLLGSADSKYYDQAKKLYEKGELEENSIGYRGLVNYMKRSGKIKELKATKLQNIKAPKEEIKQEPKRATKALDPDSNDITL